MLAKAEVERFYFYRRRSRKQYIESWKYRNDKVYGNCVSQTHISDKIIEVLNYWLWTKPKLHEHVARLMMG